MIGRAEAVGDACLAPVANEQHVHVSEVGSAV